MSSLIQTVQVVQGETYTLSFDVDVVSGLLKAYQGTQLIYDMAAISLSVYDSVFVSTSLNMKRISPLVVSSPILVTESVTINIV